MKPGKRDLGKSKIACAVLLSAASIVVFAGAASAAEVRVEGLTVFYKAKTGEVNTVVVTHIPGSGDPGASSVSTIQIRDTTAPTTPLSGCTRNGPDGVACRVQVPAEVLPRVSLDLGNKDDQASQTTASSQFSLPMDIHGGLGDDTLSGGFNGDTIDGGPGGDTIDGDDGDDVLKGGSGNDRIKGGRGSDRIDGELGDDLELDGGSGDDVIHGGPGNDHLIGGAGKDQLFGDIGKDTLLSRDGEVDALDCGSGDDTVDRDSADSTKHCRR